MRKAGRFIMLIVIVSLLLLNFAPYAQAMTSLQSAEGIIIVIGQNAMINMNGSNYLILKENTSYTQFENRHIKMYNIHIDHLDGYLIIDFTGFRLIDAFA
jgi:hypothetical protein